MRWILFVRFRQVAQVQLYVTDILNCVSREVDLGLSWLKFYLVEKLGGKWQLRRPGWCDDNISWILKGLGVGGRDGQRACKVSGSGACLSAVTAVPSIRFLSLQGKYSHALSYEESMCEIHLTRGARIMSVFQLTIRFPIIVSLLSQTDRCSRHPLSAVLGSRIMSNAQTMILLTAQFAVITCNKLTFIL
jgi:hypothetical protein